MGKSLGWGLLEEEEKEKEREREGQGERNLAFAICNIHYMYMILLFIDRERHIHIHMYRNISENLIYYTHSLQPHAPTYRRIRDLNCVFRLRIVPLASHTPLPSTAPFPPFPFQGSDNSSTNSVCDWGNNKKLPPWAVHRS